MVDQQKEKKMTIQINSKKESLNPLATSTYLIENYDFEIKNQANDKNIKFNSKKCS